MLITKANSEGSGEAAHSRQKVRFSGTKLYETRRTFRQKYTLDPTAYARLKDLKLHDAKVPFLMKLALYCSVIFPRFSF